MADRPGSGADEALRRELTGELPVELPRRYELRKAFPGGMAHVLLAFDRELRRECVIKFPRAATLATDRAMPRFVREARSLRDFRHPGIPTIYEFVADAPVPYLVQEYVNGPNLAELVDGQGPLVEARALPVMIRLAEILGEIHEASLLHRDIKPSNVVLAADGQPKLLDFGLVLPLDRTRITQGGAMVGTLAFMAPELFSGGAPTRRSDLFSLGQLYHFLLTGRLIDRDTLGPDDWRSLADPAVPTPPPDPSCPTSLMPIIEACCRKDPETRIESCAELLHLLRSLEARPIRSRPAGREAGPPPVGTGPARPKPRKASRAVLVALLLLVLGGSVSWLSRARRAPGSEPAHPSSPDAPGIRSFLAENASAWMLHPAGFAFLLPPKTGQRLHWSWTSGNEAPMSGLCLREATGWMGGTAELPVGRTGTLTLFDGDRRIGEEQLQLPTKESLDEPRVTLGASSLHLTWSFPGHAPVDVKATFGDHPRSLRVPAGHRSCVVPYPKGRPGKRLTWQLSVLGQVLGHGAHTWGARPMFELQEPGPNFSRACPPLVTESSLVLSPGTGRVLSLERSDGTSEARLSLRWAWSPPSSPSETDSHVVALESIDEDGLLVLLSGSTLLHRLSHEDRSIATMLPPAEPEAETIPLARSARLSGKRESTHPLARPVKRAVWLRNAMGERLLFVTPTTSPKELDVYRWRSAGPRLERLPSLPLGGEILHIQELTADHAMALSRTPVGLVASVLTFTADGARLGATGPLPGSAEPASSPCPPLVSPVKNRNLVLCARNRTLHAIALTSEGKLGITRSSLPIPDRGRVEGLLSLSPHRSVALALVPREQMAYLGAQALKVCLIDIVTEDPLAPVSRSFVVREHNFRIRGNWHVPQALQSFRGQLFLVLGSELALVDGNAPFRLRQIWPTDPLDYTARGCVFGELGLSLSKSGRLEGVVLAP